jgi:PilZ domain
VNWNVEPAVADPWPARIESISRGGLKIVIELRFEVGTVLKVEVAVPGEEGFSMSVVRVVRVAQESSGLWGLGCAFIQEISERKCRCLMTKEGS